MYAQTVASQQHRSGYKVGNATRKSTMVRSSRRPRNLFSCHMPRSQPARRRWQVDETLFGGSGKPTAGGMSVISSAQMKSIQGLVGTAPPDSITMTDLQRMRDTASGELERRAQAAQAAAGADKQAKLAKAKARKAHMAELEEQRKRDVPPSEIAQMKMKEKAAVPQRVEQRPPPCHHRPPSFPSP